MCDPSAWSPDGPARPVPRGDLGVDVTNDEPQAGGFRRPDGSWDWEHEQAAAPVAGRTVLGRVAAVLDGGGLRRALVPVCCATVAAGLAGAALAGRLNPSGVAQLAAVGPAAALAAPAVIAAALLFLHRQVRADVVAGAARWRLLSARGANPLQLLLLAAGPRALLALAAGVLVPLAVAPLAAVLPLRAPGVGVGALLGQAWLWSVAAGVAAAGVTLHAAREPVLRDPARAHPRQRVGGWRAPVVFRWYLDVVLLALSGAVGPLVAGEARGGAAAAAAATLSGPAFSSGGLPPVSAPPPHPLLAPLAYVAPAAFALGAALLGARLAVAAAAWLDRRARRLASAVVLPLRAVSRGRGWGYLLVPCLAAASATFAFGGSAAVMATSRAQAAMRAGSDLRLEEAWPAPCAGFCTETILQALPVPDIASTNRGLPGVVAATALVPAQDQVQTGSVGTTPATLVGISPAAYAAVVRWPQGYAATGRRALALLTAHGRGAVISEALAQATGLRAGQTMQSGLMGVVPVLAVVPSWPGMPVSVGPWALVRWSALLPALQQHGAYNASGFDAYALMRLMPHARVANIVAALSQRGLRARGAVRAAKGGGPAPLAWVLWPLGLLAAVLAFVGLRLGWRDEESLPVAEVELALSASEAARVAGELAVPALGGAGLAWGALAGWAASGLFWPDLQAAAGSVPGAVLNVPLGGWLALAVALLAGVRLRAVWPRAADAPDPVLGERLDAAGSRGHAAAAEPPPLLPREVAGSRPGGGAQAHGPAAVPRAVFTVLMLAARRLRASWIRVLGLAFGLLLAAAVAATVPLYTAGSLTRVLQAGLQPYNDRPAGAVLVRWLPPSQPGLTGSAGLPASAASRLASLTAGVGRGVGLPATPLVRYAATQDQQVITQAEISNPYASGVYFGGTSIDMLTHLRAHVHMVLGRAYHTAPERGGILEAIVTQEAYKTDHLQVGQVYLYPSAAVPGSYVRLRLVGVFQQLDPTGPFWPYRYFTSDFFVAPSAFSALEAKGQVTLGEAAWYTSLHLRRLIAQQVPAVMTGVQRAALQISGVVPGARMDVSPYAELSAFVQREETLTGLLRLVSVPILAIALYFVAITASLIVAADRGEIAVFASRGAPVGQILSLYLLEWVLLAIPVAALGPFPAALFSRVVGSSEGFLHFAAARPLPVFIRPIDFAYAGVAAALGVLAAMVPVLVGLGRSIVSARLRSSRTVDQPLWQRAYLDGVALLLLAVIWWVFHKASVQGGGGAAALVGDPALFVLPPVFLVVSGLLVVRFLGWLLRTLDALAGPFVRPALSLPLRRIGRLPSQFAPVLLLLCFTAALGSYSAASARTLDQNLTAAADYQVGAQVQLQEVSPCSIMKPEIGVCLTYDNAPIGPQGVRPMPPFSLHAGVPGLRHAAELVQEQVTVQGPLNSGQADLVLVNPSTYAQVAWWMPGLNPHPLLHYVNLLTSQPGAALVDPAFANQMGLQVGQSFSLSDGIYNGTFTDVGAVQRWSGADANAPLVVANLAYAKSAMGMIPAYRTALLQLSPHASLPAIETALADKGIFTQASLVASTLAGQALSTPEWAGQTGMLTVGFLTALGITILGYLLYAVVLLRGQLSQLGLLFALGLPWGSVLATVAVEQGTLLLFGAAAGAAAGLVAAALFLPLLRPAFTGPNAPPFLALGPGGALAQVAVVLVALLAIALGALLFSLRRLHVGETLKLEE